jgi:ferredoxin-NADP reductase
MGEVRGRLIARIKRTPSVESFQFVTQAPFDFFPGQFLELIFDEENRGNKELNKYLSLSSSPGLPYVEVTKRLSNSLFSSRLKALAFNDRVILKGPLGNCVYRDEYRRIGFLIGGIGITPVISIIEYITRNALDTDVVLVYSNRTEEEIAFKKELDRWQSLNSQVKVIYLVTDCQPKDATCVYGTINKELLRSRVCDLNRRLFFIFGPPKMVEAMKTLAMDLDCASENIRTETFIGY